MLEIWGRKNSFNVQKVLWCCEELEIPYQRHDAGGQYGVTDQDEYLQRNPTGLVPTAVDGDLTLWESNTIVRYLSARYGAGSLWPEDPAERALADKWMDYQLGTVFPAFKGALVGLVRTAPENRDPEKIEASVRATADGGKVTEFKARLRLDTPQEVQYYRHGGILHYVLRQLASSAKAA